MVSHCACPTRVFGDRALHEHGRPSSLPSHAPSKLACFPSLGMAPVLVPLRPSSEALPILSNSLLRSGQGCPLLRASDEHCFIVRVLRARRASGRSFPVPPACAVLQTGVGFEKRAVPATIPLLHQMVHPSSLVISLLWTGTHVGPTAAVERAHSDRARSGSTGPTWVAVHALRRLAMINVNPSGGGNPSRPTA